MLFVRATYDTQLMELHLPLWLIWALTFYLVLIFSISYFLKYMYFETVSSHFGEEEVQIKVNP